MKLPSPINFQFSIFNFQSIFKNLIIIFLATCYLLLATTPAAAQTNPAFTPNTNPDVPKNLHNWTQNVMIEVMSAMVCQLTGVDVVNKNQPCLGVDPKSGKIGFVESGGGAIGAMGDIIAMTYTPAFHTGDYFGYLAQNFGIAKPAYAANHDRGRTGAGFDSLSPIINLWIAFRNLVYLLFVAVFAVVGFAIMLRINIDPRTVMTIANQLPKMIIAILLVTFSFAISGGLIDLMWASIYVTTNVITSSDPKEKYISQKTAQAVVQSANPLEAANIIGGEEEGKLLGVRTDGALGLARIAEEPANAFGNVSKPLFESSLGKWTLGVVTGILTAVVSSKVPLVSNLIDGLASFVPFGGKAIVAPVLKGLISLGLAGAAGLNAEAVGSSVITFIIYIVLVIAILWALFRLTFQLIIAYVTVLIHTVLAPFWIIGGLFPGSPIGFGAWFREMLGALSVFPVTIGMFLLGRIFMAAFDEKGINQFAPPMTGNPNAGNFGAFIGLGIILLTPQVVTIMKELFKSPQFKQGGAVAQAVGFGLGAVNVPQLAQKVGMYGYYTGQLKKFPILGKFLGGKPKDDT